MALKDNRIRAVINLSRQAFGKYKLQIIILTMLGFLSGSLEAIGVNALIPLFSFATNSGDRGSDIISVTIEKLFSFFNINFNLKFLLIFICSLFVFKAIVLVLSNYIKIKITADYEERTRTTLFEKTLNANWPYLLKQKLGYLETVIITDVRYGAVLLRQVSTVIMILASLIMYILIAVNISIYITLITLILGAIIFLIFKPLVYKTRVNSQKITDLHKKIAHFINENIIGIKTVKSMSISKEINTLAKEYFNKFKNLEIKIFFFKNLTGSFLQPISLIFICVVFAFSYKTPNFKFAAFIVVIYLVQRIFQYIQQLQLNLHTVSEAVPYLKNVISYEEQAINNTESSRGVSKFSFKDSVEFNNISFFYNKDKKVLRNVNLKINKGEMVGLIGASGSGKTTIVDLILRLFNPSKGKILIDDKDINDINLEQWRKNIGYVSQDIFLINDTIENNIKFHNSSITEKEIVKAAKMANIYNFIMECQDKFSTLIGERGVLLSAGQRQRIIIARVLARQPQLLILDEATSALDNESEIKIQKVIENLKGKVTVFVIAHRLSTIMNSDRLLVLEKGKIVEQGKPQELLKNKESYFYKVYNIRK